MKEFMMLTIAILMSSSLSLAADKTELSKSTKPDKGSWMNMSADMRKQMAEMHQKMAECLKSDKAVSECRDAMMANCPMMKDGSCPMMGMMRGYHNDDDYDHDCMHH